MDMKLGSNIRECRKAVDLTQEQLAEAMGVTIGAVSKWEHGLANPDLNILIEMARFFQVSVDALIGYEINEIGVDIYRAKITECRERRNYEEGKKLCQQALVKYPNHFQVVAAAAEFYRDAGMSDENNQECYEKALMLFERALGLLSQRNDKDLTREEINLQISELYMFLGRLDEAVTYAKEHNTGGINNILIGRLYYHKKNFEEAKIQLGQCFIQECIRIFEVVNILVQVWFRTGCYESAIKLLHMLKNMWSMIRTNEISYADRLIALTDAMLAIAYYHDEAERETSMEKCRESLEQAIEEAGRYDEDPSFSINLQSLSVEQLFNDDMGEKAIDAIKKLIAMEHLSHTSPFSEYGLDVAGSSDEKEVHREG